MDLAAIRAEIGEALSVVDPLNVITTKPGSIAATPALIVAGYQKDPHVSSGVAKNRLTWDLILLIADSADGSFEQFDAYMSDEGDLSIERAVEDWRPTNWSDLQCLESQPMQEYTIGAVSYIGCAIPVEIFA